MIGQSFGAEQPGVNDAPFVLSTGLEIQQRRSIVLQFVEEPQRVLTRWSTWIDGFRQNPVVPLLQYQDPCFALLHRRAFSATGKAVATELTAPVRLHLQRKWAAPPRTSTFTAPMKAND